MNDESQIQPIESLSMIIEITAGSHHSIALSDNGMWVWGKADACNVSIPFGQQSVVKQPHFVDIDADHACAGEDHSFAWKNNEVYCWGSNRSYKLGFEQVRQYGLSKSQIFTEAIESDMELCQITCGDSHSLAVFRFQQEQTLKYQIFAWGQSKSYQLALETQGAVSEPIMIDFEEPVEQIYSRNDYNFIITKAGQPYSWGTNIFGRLGFPNSIKNQKFPTLIKTLPKIRAISMGKYHCVAISDTNEAYSWGHGMHGQLGLNQIVYEKTPTKIPLTGRVIQAACGEQHTVILTENNILMSCGSNAYSALGHDEVDQTKRCRKFTQINKVDQIQGKIKKIVSGNKHNLLLTMDGKVYSWGCNKFGQLGRGDTSKQETRIKRELYKQQVVQMKKQPELLNNKQKQNSIYQLSHNLESNVVFNQKSNFKLKIENWKTRYQKFQIDKQKQQRQIMKELEQIMKEIQ